MWGWKRTWELFFMLGPAVNVNLVLEVKSIKQPPKATLTIGVMSKTHSPSVMEAQICQHPVVTGFPVPWML